MKERIGVMGAGVMGAGIAQVLAVAGHEVVCYDLDPEALDRGRKGVESGRFGIRSAVGRGRITQGEGEAALGRLTFSHELEQATQVDVVVEAVPERLELKIRVFRDLDGRVPERAILASNSSGFPIAALAAVTNRSDRVIGWHWASPAPVMKLAEIVRGPGTSDETTETIQRIARNAGKNPIVVKDHPREWGYVTNRVYFAMIREAQQVVSEGIATAEEVDQLMVDCFRWPVGPLAMVRGAGSGWG
jgi:3-hydroxybutyryl-CoA dehydrogenase